MCFTGATNSHKKALYEPDGVERCRQYVCSQKKAITVLALVLSCIVIVAIIAALARPFHGPCPGESYEVTEHSVITEKASETTDDPFPYREIRLPDNVFPIAYSLSIHPNLTTFKFTGKVEIILQATESTNFIILHVKSLKISNAELTVTDTSNKVSLGSVYTSEKLQQQYYEVTSSLDVGVNYTFQLEYEGDIASALAGFYRSSYKTKSGEQRWVRFIIYFLHICLCIAMAVDNVPVFSSLDVHYVLIASI